ncbi:hypothetical protein V6N13_071572 [Hibiscus sabdariffa]
MAKNLEDLGAVMDLSNVGCVERYQRHITNSYLCGLCGERLENVDHVLRSCVMVRSRRCCLVLASRESYRDDILVCGDRMVEEPSRSRGLGAGQMTFSVPPTDIFSLIEEEFLGPTSAVGEATGIMQSWCAALDGLLLLSNGFSD